MNQQISNEWFIKLSKKISTDFEFWGKSAQKQWLSYAKSFCLKCCHRQITTEGKVIFISVCHDDSCLFYYFRDQTINNLKTRSVK
jgi:hypothetical protein